jgi:hypothetical protein
MLRSRISPLVCCLLLVLATTARAAPGDYILQTIDLPFQGSTFPTLVRLVAVTDALTFAGDASVPGGLGFRISQALALTPVLCPDFTRYPFSDRLGPEVVGMNNAEVVALNDEGLENQFGGVQTPDGTCTFTLVEGSVGTRYTGISEQIPRSSRRNPLPMKRIHRSLLRGHEHVACALRERRPSRQTPSGADRVFPDAPEACDGLAGMPTRGREAMEAPLALLVRFQ